MLQLVIGKFIESVSRVKRGKGHIEYLERIQQIKTLSCNTRAGTPHKRVQFILASFIIFYNCSHTYCTHGAL